MPISLQKSSCKKEISAGPPRNGCDNLHICIYFIYGFASQSNFPSVMTVYSNRFCIWHKFFGFKTYNMVKIVPTIDTERLQSIKKTKTMLVAKAFHLVHKDTQFSGEYDDERTTAFANYVQTATHARTLWHCLRPGLVAITGVTIVEFTPLAPIAEGVFGNYASLPIVLFISVCLCSISVLLMFHLHFPTIPVRWWTTLSVALVGGCTFVCTFLLGATFYCYPLPFGAIVPSVTTIPVLCSYTYCIFHKEVRKVPNSKAAMFAFVQTGNLMLGMMTMYPFLMQLHFRYFRHSNLREISFAALLFAVRAVLRWYLVFVCKYSKRITPCSIVIMVNAFHSVYISITMQQSVSISLTACVMVMDAVGNFASFFQLYYKYMKVRRENNKVQKTERARELLVLSENIGLLEYVECIVPLMFSYISFIFYYSPNRFYVEMFHPSHYTIDSVRHAVISLALYGMVEITALVVFCLVLLKKMDLPIWHQVGFALNDSFLFTTALLFTWFIYSIAGTMEQLGHDWTFQFDWECNP